MENFWMKPSSGPKQGVPCLIRVGWNRQITTGSGNIDHVIYIQCEYGPLATGFYGPYMEQLSRDLIRAFGNDVMIPF